MHPKSPNVHARTGIVLACLMSTTFPVLGSIAQAQPWLPDRAYTEGPGIRLGDLELHPGVAVRGGYDSNVFRADGQSRVVSTTESGAIQTRDFTQQVRGSGILAVSPHIHLSTLSAQRRAGGEDREGAEGALPTLAFRGGVSGTYLHIFLEDAPKSLEVDSDLWLSILPQRPFNVDLNFSYVRNVRPFTQYAGERNAYDYNVIQPRVRFNFGSRSQVLTTFVGYAPRITLFESALFDYLDSISHGIESGMAWKFLPNTAMIFDGNVDLQKYSESDPYQTRSPVLFSDSVRFRGRLGLNGAITRTLSLRVLAGYGAIALRDTVNSQRLDDHEDVIGEAVLGWRFGMAQLSSLEFGYQRDLVATALGGWTLLDRGFVTLRADVARTVMLSLEGGAAYLTYGRLWGLDRRSRADRGLPSGADESDPVPLGAGGTVDRNDVRLDGAVRAEYRATNWLSFMADLSVQAVLTDFEYALLVLEAPIPDPAKYVSVMAFAGVRAHY